MLYQGDCLEIMPTLLDKSIDMILCDLPYGTTACKWDTIIPFEPLWKQYRRLIKDNGAIVLTASQPFTSALVMSNPKMFKYEWIWDKGWSGKFGIVQFRPHPEHENILIFSKGTHTYNPQMEQGVPYKENARDAKYNYGNNHKYGISGNLATTNTGTRFPGSIRHFNCQMQECNNTQRIHPTQKPVALFEYLIRTYTNEGDTVLDNCAGSGTTGVACLNANRKCILIEKDVSYYEIIRKRLDDCQKQSKLF